MLTHRNSVSLWFTYKLNKVNIEIDYSLRSDAILHVPEICLGNRILTKHMKFNKISSLLHHIEYSLENWVEDIDSNDVLEWI
ncbi:hypothetical protein TwortDSMZ_152 [Staphylococcus phage Twort]|uniref:ORF155 n=2 Tax=Staphylococcus phage Twort (strain DSM 17442 / HER 48) TaxID=2908167 RepID=Q4Z993_BPTWO|nr:ORF155 [Staphylococcus phage Twort]AAX92434.1 ORF155 [Staphylococcus phage Twort]QIW89207.1 hypothetical protein TwortDSMZ_152 [Staphylococcus phage Twort]